MTDPRNPAVDAAGVDPLADSHATWHEAGPEGPPPAVPPELFPPEVASVRERLAALRARHALRRERAAAVYQEALNPKRGWPVADSATVRAFLLGLIRERRRVFIALVLLNGLAAATGLVMPRLLGALVNRVAGASEVAEDVVASSFGLNQLAVLIVIVVVTQAALTFLAQRTSTIFGQDLLAAARESVVDSILALPLGRVEGASTGDLITRVTRDVASMSRSVQYAVPMAIISVLTVSLSVVAMLLNSVVLAVPSLLVIASSFLAIRSYLRQAPKAYVTEGATYSRINTTLTETVEGARTIEALRLADQRLRTGDDDLAVSAQAERYGMTLRNLLFAVIDLAFNSPRVVTLVVGAWAYANDLVTLGQITAAVLYVEALSGPLDRLIGELDRLQVGLASTARLLGISTVPPDRTPGSDVPVGRQLVGRDLRFAYREGHDVLFGIDLELEVGERLAIVGPSGSGKSTLGRLLSGINRPRTGAVTVGDVDVVDLPLDVLRTEVALVTQEHHVFIGSVRDNVILAREDSDDETVRKALAAVGAMSWVDRLPAGLDTTLGSGHHALTPAQAQQIALARLIIADPHTLVLDEATSLIDPRTARTLEGSMHALLTDRTVVAIAHRLHTAHDAERIAVVIDGRIVELGSHHELVEAGGEYAALWRAWTS